MDLATLISRTSPFPILEVSGGIFCFYLIFERTFCKQTVETLIRHHDLQRLIWVCTFCLCPTKRMLGLYGLILLHKEISGGIFCFYLIFERTFCKQTVETLIRHHDLQRLIWVCTFCLCPTKRMLGLYGLTLLHKEFW